MVVNPEHTREFALDVVGRLREAGYQAIWAGGCVRDGLLGRVPKDYDVATDATPDQIREVFGRRRTLAVGQAFGVICVRGTKTTGLVDVATFRCDAEYSDGRHPDHVTFSTPEKDAQRRDFTINGLFYDPLEKRVIDYVGGEADLERRVVRAIGDPHARIAEDKLRMLRAVRMASTYGFEIEPVTFAAVRTHAEQLVVVSAERIAAELRRMLVHDGRRRAVQLLQKSSLLAVIVPELQLAIEAESGDASGDHWQQTLEILQRLDAPSFAVAFAALLRPLAVRGEGDLSAVAEIGTRLRLSNEERDGMKFCLAHETAVRAARSTPWPRLQRILIRPRVAELMQYCQAVAEVEADDVAEIAFCESKLALPLEQLDPPPLITGDDLRAANLRRGPHYRQILDAVRDAQLEQRITTHDEALQMALQIAATQEGQFPEE